MKPRLSVLLVSHVPLRQELGAARVYLALADGLRRSGHHVETFDFLDAFPAPQPRRRRYQPNLFARAAFRRVREAAVAYDVVDAQHGDLPYTKEQMRHEGLLVARSQGLYAIHEEFFRFADRRWPELMPGTHLGRAAARWHRRLSYVAARRSLETCDLAVVLTEDEREWVTRELDRGEVCYVLPNGLDDEAAAALAVARLPAAERLARREVAVVGSWSLLKGAADWPRIIDGVRRRMPGTRFCFLGTGVGREVVSDALALGPGGAADVVPRYEPSELPRLLAGATLGALPSYADGWGIGVLEQLAAGLPTLAYDAPGPKAMLEQVSTTLTVPRGDVDAFVGRLTALLQLDVRAYDQLSARCIEVSARFRWRAAVQQMEDLYIQQLGRLRAEA